MKRSVWSMMFVSVALLIVSTARADVPDQRPDHHCGPQFGGTKCGTDRCCSSFGWCGGLTEAHCTTARGFSGQFDGPRNVPDQRADHHCGPQFGGSKCGTDRCCSSFGWCGGLTEAHCNASRGFSGQFDGPRSAPTPPTPPPSPPAPPAPPAAVPDQRADHHCGPQFGGSKCGTDRCCSSFGWCGGLTEAHCNASRGYSGQFDGPRGVPTPPPAALPDQRADHHCGPQFGGSKCGTDRCCSSFGWCGGLTEAHCNASRGYSGQFDGPRP